MDRRLATPRPIRPPSESDSDAEVLEKHRRIEERWKYDDDDVPPVGPEGPEEQDRKLADDFDAKYAMSTLTLR